MYLKFGNYGFRSHLRLTLSPSQLHQKGAVRPLPRYLWGETPASSKVTQPMGFKSHFLKSNQNLPSKNSCPALPSATKSEFIPSSTSQALPEFRAIHLYPHTTARSSSSHRGLHYQLDQKKVEKAKKNIGQDLVNKPGSHKSKCQITLNQALTEPQ